MRWLRRWAFRLAAVLLLAVIGLLAPVAYVETACRPGPAAAPYAAILAPEHQRAEGRTLMTYPEWHIVHAYDDYARVIRGGDPHDYAYLRAVTGFWSSLCALSRASGAHGGFDGETKQTIYTIGVSFTVELLAKAAYEETLGRIATLLRGEDRAPLDDLSAAQAADYAAFLQQVPWYKWDFTAAAAALSQNAGESIRDRERALAVGLEYRAKAAYARLIDRAVAGIGADALTLRMVVRGLPPTMLDEIENVEVIAANDTMVEIETPRYRRLTRLLDRLAGLGADFVEIAGNDDILFTAISAEPAADGAVFSFARQGYGDTRHLILVKVSALADRLRAMQSGPLTLEHVHDY